MPEVLLQVQLEVPLAPTRGQQPRHPDRLHGRKSRKMEMEVEICTLIHANLESQIPRLVTIYSTQQKGEDWVA